MSRKKQKAKDVSVKVPQKDKIKESITVYERDDLTEKQKRFIELVMDKDTKIVFVNGPAGTSKTFLSVYCGLHLLNDKRVSDLIYFRTIVESAGKSLGSLPGELSEKFSPFMMPLEDKLDELMPRADIQRLMKEERIQAMPINYLRGASFNAKFLLADEAQNFTYSELTTLITRYGHETIRHWN
jgi:predicted ribonuclease YlaK